MGELKKAYHGLLLALHPDKQTKSGSAGATGADGAKSRRETVKGDIPAIQKAYRVLTTQREAYDVALAEHRVVSGVADGSGLDHVDLGQFDMEFDHEYVWIRACQRCEVGQHIVRESQLEGVQMEDGEGEVAVQCENCSLWIKVGFKED